ncbi:hypothetical protein [Microcystis sp. M169S2]|uniref:hypothetical protein n=1 Tax=Microcystis sp. M169S2 TaxID=2771157 RepID=UPI00258EF3DA|nr:hypothetical protein [Microcystis sp. M169S2]
MGGEILTFSLKIGKIPHPTPVRLSSRPKPTPHTPHPTPHTLHPTPYTPHPTPYTPHPTKNFLGKP